MKSKTKFKQTEIGLVPEDWEVGGFSQFIRINPKRAISKNKVYKKVSMDLISPFNRKINGYTLSNFKGGSKFQNEDTLLARITPCLENGKTAFVDLLEDQELAFGSTEFIVLSGKKGISDNKFVYYLVTSPRIRNELIQSMIGTSGRQRIPNEIFDQIEIKLPLLPEQRAIASVLSSFDDKIELLEKQNETLEKIGEALFKHWFVDFEFPDENGKPYKSSGGKMVWSEELQKEIPKEWKIGYFGDNISTKIIKPGIEKYFNQKIYLDTASVQNSSIIDFTTVITFNNRPSRANMQPVLESVWFAKMKNSKKVLFISKEDQQLVNKIILSTGFFGIKPLNNLEYYIWAIVNSNSFEEKKDLYCLGTTMQAINKENLSKINYLIPNQEMLNYFNKSVENVYLKICLNKHQIEYLKQTRDLLLPKLMSGKIRISVAVN